METRTANYAIQNCDLLIVLGSRLDVRQTGSDTEDFARKAKIVQIDIDVAQLSNRIKADLDVHCDCETFFAKFDGDLNTSSLQIDNGWKYELVNHWSETYMDEYLDWNISPFQICKALEDSFKKIPVHYVTDVGNNQMWAAHSILLNPGQAIHHSGGLGAMGFAIPTGIGVAYATQAPVIVLTGDGGAQLNIQELDIIAREQLPILTVVFNNESLGMVRAFQDMYFDGRDESTYWNGYSSSFCSLGRAYNVTSFSTSSMDELKILLSKFAAHPETHVN